MALGCHPELGTRDLGSEAKKLCWTEGSPPLWSYRRDPLLIGSHGSSRGPQVHVLQLSPHPGHGPSHSDVLLGERGEGSQGPEVSAVSEGGGVLQECLAELPQLLRPPSGFATAGPRAPVGGNLGLRQPMGRMAPFPLRGPLPFGPSSVAWRMFGGSAQGCTRRVRGTGSARGVQ
mgnify:CR=1 FL=1